MGYYINPESGTKMEWLLANGTSIPPLQAKEHSSADSDSLVVCLVDNGAFFAAGIAYDDRERDAFMLPDSRPKKFFLVSREKLLPWYDPKEHG